MARLGLVALGAVTALVLIVGGIWLAQVGSQAGWLPRNPQQAQALVLGVGFFLIFSLELAIGIIARWPGPRGLPVLVVAVFGLVGIVLVVIDALAFRGEPTGRAGAIVWLPAVLVLAVGFRLVMRHQGISRQ